MALSEPQEETVYNSRECSRLFVGGSPFLSDGHLAFLLAQSKHDNIEINLKEMFMAQFQQNNTSRAHPSPTVQISDDGDVRQWNLVEKNIQPEITLVWFYKRKKIPGNSSLPINQDSAYGSREGCSNQVYIELIVGKEVEMCRVPKTSKFCQFWPGLLCKCKSILNERSYVIKELNPSDETYDDINQAEVWLDEIQRDRCFAVFSTGVPQNTTDG